MKSTWKHVFLSALAFAVFSSASYALDLNRSSHCRDSKCFLHTSVVEKDALLATPKWTDLSKPAPFTASQAAQAAKKYASKAYAKLPKRPEIGSIQLKRYAFSAFGKMGAKFSDNWFYIISFSLPWAIGPDTAEDVVILMDGTVVPTTVTEME